MKNAETTGPSIRESGNQTLIDRVQVHLGEEFLDMSPDVAAQFDQGDFYDSDPRSRASWKILGEETGRCRFKPRKNNHKEEL
jgi:hypothetical protein